MIELSWPVYALLASLLFGIAMSLYKMPAAKNQSRFFTSFAQNFTGLVLALIFFLKFLYPVSKQGIILSLIVAVIFVSLSLLQMYTLKYIDTSSLFPITTTGSLVLTVLAGLILFRERISLVGAIGILLVMIIVYNSLYKGKKMQYSKQVAFLGIALIFISALNKVFQKFAADTISIQSFIIYQHLFATLLTIPLLLIFHKKDLRRSLTRKAFMMGGLIGFFGFFGFYSLLLALSKGPLTLISPIQSTYILVTAIVSAFLYKEKLTKKTIFMIILAIISVFLIRLNPII